MKLLNPNIPPDTVQANRLQAVVLDWAGTTVDFGSVAPVRTLQQVFAGAGIDLSAAEARRDMGLPKKDHIGRILLMPRVREEWQRIRGHLPLAADTDELYRVFVPLQLSHLAEYSGLIPGVLDAVDRFRSRGLKIGSTTGYTREMLNVLLQKSASAGYEPDSSLTPEDVGAGRPHPFMLYETAVRLQIAPLASIAKIGDTPADVEEGLNAGAWSIGVAGTGNGVGRSHAEFQALPAAEKRDLLSAARSELERAGAHYVIDTLADAHPVLDEIDKRLKAGHSSHQPLQHTA